MKQKLLLFLFLSLSLTISSKETKAQVNLNILQTNITPIIDGDIDPLWNNYSSQPLDKLLDGPKPSNSDFSAWFKTTWDKTNLYIITVVTDESKINDSGDIWKDDAVEIYIDIDNNKLSSYGANDYQYTFRWNDPTIHNSNGNTNGIEFKIKGTSTGYILETKFPWSTLGEDEAKNGVLMGLDVHIHDDDDGTERDNKISWYTTTDQSWNNPSLFATVSLIGETVIMPSAEKPKISVDRGFYSQPFDATISSSLEGMNIYYTLDGTDPISSITAQKHISPVTVRIDPLNTSNRGKTPGVVLRAVAKKEGYEFSESVTNSYIFINEIKNQVNHPGHDWPNTNYINDQEIDLLMDPQVLNDNRYKNLIDDALLEIPTITLTTDLNNLFNPQNGIYVNAMEDGSDWERPASVELIYPDGSKGFQINSGLRIRGGWSRHGYFRKHAFRLFFRNEYGEGKLDYPLFENEGVSSFDKIDLRCAQNYSWSKGGSEAPYFTFTRDVFSRDIQRAMSRPYTRSRYYHLYINGLYWGLYQTQERSEARYAESYFGGNSEDYDVIKQDGVTDGNDNAWIQLWEITQSGYQNNINYYKIQGLDASGRRDPSISKLVDIDNLIDYMNIIFYTGNFDAPVSAFGGNTNPNNYYAIYNRNGAEGFKFFAHDNEHTLLYEVVPGNPHSGLFENRVNIGSESTSGSRMVINDFWQFNPQWLHYKLSFNPEYRQRFSDRAYKHLYNDGVLTPEFTAETFKNRTLQIDTAVIAESARWGDIEEWTRYTKDDHWIPMVNNTLLQFFPQRTNIVIQQLIDERLLPSIKAPEYYINNTKTEESIITVNKGTTVKIINPVTTGSLKYTLDGSDPRLNGGTISQNAADGGDEVSINVLQTTIVNARVLNASTWSALHTIQLNVEESIDNIQITEINYNPLGDGDINGSEFEFIEIKNLSSKQANLTGTAFVDGITYSFNANSVINPGNFLVIASNSFYFKQRYGFDPDGVYEGQLDNKGERISLVDVAGDTIVTLKYNDNTPWPSSTDGLGFSLVPVNSNLSNDWSDGTNWRASSSINGSPKSDDNSITIDPVFINEILSNSEQPDVDAIELYNPNSKSIDISGWYLSDNRRNPKKWKIPNGTTIPSNGYKVFYEGHYSGSTIAFTASEFGSSFSLSSHGEDVYIFSANSNGDLTGYEHGFDYGEIETGVTFGRHIISTGNDHFVAQSTKTLNKVNSSPRVGPIVIKQIMYNPGPEGYEYLELVNISNSNVDLWDAATLLSWKIEGVGFEFPKNITINPGESVYITETAISPQDFRSLYNIDPKVKVFNYPSKLNNGGEEITLFKSAGSYSSEGTTYFPYIRIDKVEYNNKTPWPDADGNDNILVRKNMSSYGDDPANWIASPPIVSINTAILASGTRGVTYNAKLEASGGTPPYKWSIISGNLPQGLTFDNSTGIINGTATLTGTFNIGFKITDLNLFTDEEVLQITIKENTLPLAYNDTVTTNENYNIIADVLSNDRDLDGDAFNWEITIGTKPVHGTAIVNEDKTITYIPEKGFSGQDILTYKINDVYGFASAKLIININKEEIISLYDIRINQQSDDAEENINSGQIWLNSSDLEFVYDVQPGGDQIVGLRFNNIEIPQGKAISNAYIQFTTDEITSNPASLQIKGEASDNSETFITSNFNIATRILTNSQVSWNPDAWNIIGESSEAQRTPDISNLVQEIVNRSGWNSGNSLTFVFSGTGTRTAVAHDLTPASAPLLHIESEAIEPVVPIANAGSSQSVLKGSTVKLDGSLSYSPDERKLNYRWNIVSKPNGSNAILSNANIVNPVFTADMFGVYELSLIVDNGFFESQEVKIRVTSDNLKPLANAGEDISKTIGSIVQLSGSKSYDPEGATINYYWTIISKPAGSKATLTNSTIINPSFPGDLAGNYIIRLVVSDGELQSVADEIIITILENQNPIADAGANQTVNFGTNVTLDGLSSYDPEGTAITFKWSFISKPAGSIASLSNPTSATASFAPDIDGIYIIKLEVSDGEKSESDNIQVIVRPPNFVNPNILAESLTVYPNPFSGKINVEFISPIDQLVKFELYNISGMLIKEYEFESSGYQNQPLDFSSCQLSEGMYFLIMKTGNNKEKVIKLGYKNDD